MIPNIIGCIFVLQFYFFRTLGNIVVRMRKIKLFINGFGRIGRCVAQIVLTKFYDKFEIVGVNDLGNIDNLAYLLTHDSVHKSDITSEKIDETTFKFNGANVVFSSIREPKNIDIYDADIVLECSGLFLKSSDVEYHIVKGAKRVIVSAPILDETKTFVFGVNHKQYNGEKIISNASCTTNALAPIVMLLDRKFGVKSGILTTIHSYTNDQKLIDSVYSKSDFRRSRAAAMNIIPTTTGAAKALHLVLPNIKDKLHGHSVRVPVADVSMVDLNINLDKSVTKDNINDLFYKASTGELKGILGVDDNYGVSQDFINNPLSCIVASDLTFVLQENMAKIMIWYDNEWGYSHRILDMSEYILH